jgi:hypothetical protein
MDLRPLGVCVMLLAPGMIRSNIDENSAANTSVPPMDSLYTAFYKKIPDSRKFTQNPRTTPADTFAREVAAAALASTPSRYLALGHSSWLVYLLTWLHRSFNFDIM